MMQLSLYQIQWPLYKWLLDFLGLPDGSDSKESACNAGDPVQALSTEDILEKVTHSSILGQKSLVGYSP